MRKYGRILLVTAIVAINCMVCTSCGNQPDSEVQILSESSAASGGKETKEHQKNDSDSLQKSNVKDGLESVPEIKDTLSKSKKLHIYCINDAGDEIEETDLLINQKTDISASLVVEKVAEEFTNQDLVIEIDKVLEDDKGNVFVSFKKDSAPEKGVEEDVEYLILECISQSILDDVETSKAVIFQIEGAAYKSSHISFDLNEAFDWK
ncbi:hypothetical protein [[Clostridium] polysaccharolyticum]|uniref:Sporulation and spore germination n=1 Tax=[Clostridium] polysaccharolyticum TaxID=29364 RepID=A0A1I0AFU3_9FIRM|nr:hypothetical protein [[Clostridium] polysaccharolyticum]SES92118.1 hypothetical protein SAMN04487772_10590 [[Clostridium] polysaccharolyticum]